MNQSNAQSVHSGNQPQNSSILYGSQYHSSPKHGSQTGSNLAGQQSNHNQSLYSSITNHQVNQMES